MDKNGKLQKEYKMILSTSTRQIEFGDIDSDDEVKISIRHTTGEQTYYITGRDLDRAIEHLSKQRAVLKERRFARRQ